MTLGSLQLIRVHSHEEIQIQYEEPQMTDISVAGPLGVTIDDRGEGRPFLLLHGGGGPQTVGGFAELLATKEPARVITPTHPGFGGTPRPDGLADMAGLAALYRELLDRLG